MSVKYKPILFNTKMVKAIMEGRKTMTRRVLRFTMADVYDFACGLGKWHESYDPHNPPQQLVEMYVRSIGKRPCEPGDILWVRETWAHPSEAEVRNGADPDVFIYKADSPLLPAAHGRWHPSIHMPKEAARIFMRVKNVWRERLKDIYQQHEPGPDNHVTKEGCNFLCSFIAVWENTIKPADHERYGWEANPWVWVIEFEPCEKPEGWPQCR
ncbi:MAG: hypothetical protein IJV91_11515 [Kiritimatiellae bacterium]|nr:hypothetical protein [Kiritimatiellia bacterium]